MSITVRWLQDVGVELRLGFGAVMDPVRMSEDKMRRGEQCFPLDGLDATKPLCQTGLSVLYLADRCTNRVSLRRRAKFSLPWAQRARLRYYCHTDINSTRLVTLAVLQYTTSHIVSTINYCLFYTYLNSTLDVEDLEISQQWIDEQSFSYGMVDLYVYVSHSTDISIQHPHRRNSLSLSVAFSLELSRHMVDFY